MPRSWEARGCLKSPVSLTGEAAGTALDRSHLVRGGVRASGWPRTVVATRLRGRGATILSLLVALALGAGVALG